MIQNSLLFSCYVNDVVLMLISWKSREVSIKTRSTLVSLSFTGQVIKHTTVKWSIEQISSIKNYPPDRDLSSRWPTIESLGSLGCLQSGGELNFGPLKKSNLVVRVGFEPESKIHCPSH